MNQLTRDAFRVLIAVIAVGLIARLVVAFATYGLDFDVNSVVIVRMQLGDDPLHLYGALNFPIDTPNFDMFYRWPYPPTYLGWIGISALLSHTGLAFDGLVQVPAIAADAGLAWLVQNHLGRRGAGESARLGAAALIMLAPPLALVSGYHGQIDSVAILPAAIAISIWDRNELWEHRHPLARALTAGLLIGLGGSVKTVPLVLLAALLPRVSSRREGVVLVASAIAVPVLLLLPFLIADPGGVSHSFGYAGYPGLGGISTVVQPGLVGEYLRGNIATTHLNGASRLLIDHGSLISLFGLGAVTLFLLRFRPEPVLGAVMIWLTLYVVGPNFFFQYLVWGFPFFLMAGQLRWCLALSIWTIFPDIVLYWDRDPSVAWAYAFAVIVLWIGWVVATAMVARRIVTAGDQLQQQPAAA